MKTESKIEGKAISRAEFQRIFSVNWAHVEKLISEKMPVVSRGGFDAGGKPRPWIFDSAKCARFMIDRTMRLEREAAEAQRAGRFLKPLDPRDPRHALATAQADRVELLNRREAADTLRKEDAVEIVAEIFGMVRAHFNKLPGAIVSRLGATGESAAKVERLLKREVDAALSGMDAHAVLEETRHEGETESL